MFPPVTAAAQPSGAQPSGAQARGLAAATLILGIFALLLDVAFALGIFLAIPAVILGCAAVWKNRRAGATNLVLAVTGLITSCAAVVLAVLVAAQCSRNGC
jgi:hypothetical protein